METSWSINAGYQATINTLAHIHGVDMEQLTLDGDPGPATEAAYKQIAEKLGLDPANTLEEQMAQIRDLSKTPEVQAEVQSALESGNIGQAQSVIAFANNDPNLEADGLSGPQTRAALEQYNQSIIEPAPDVMTAAPQMSTFQTMPSNGAPTLQQRIDKVVADGGNPVLEGLQTPEQRDNLVQVAKTASEYTAKLETEQQQLVKAIADPQNFDTVTGAIETGEFEVNEGTPEYLVTLQGLHDDIIKAEGNLQNYIVSPNQWNIDNGVVGMTGAPYPPRVQQLENGVLEAQNAYTENYNNLTTEQQTAAADYIQGNETIEPNNNLEESAPSNEPIAAVSENGPVVGNEVPGYAPGEHPFAGEAANSEIEVSAAEPCGFLKRMWKGCNSTDQEQEAAKAPQTPAAEVSRNVGTPMTLGG